MRCGFLLAFLFFLWSLPVLSHADCGLTAGLEPLDEESLTISGTASGLTPAKYQQAAGVAVMAVIQVQSAPIMYRTSGIPTTTSGTYLLTGQSFPICGIAYIKAVKFISLAPPTMLWVSYYKAHQP